MGSEDFSFMLKIKPGAYLRLVQCEMIADGKAGFTGGLGSRFLHNSCYDFNNSLLPLGAAFFAEVLKISADLSLENLLLKV